MPDQLTKRERPPSDERRRGILMFIERSELNEVADFSIEGLAGGERFNGWHKKSIVHNFANCGAKLRTITCVRKDRVYSSMYLDGFRRKSKMFTK